MSDRTTTREEIAQKIDARVSELLRLADDAATAEDASRFETRATEASHLAMMVRREG